MKEFCLYFWVVFIFSLQHWNLAYAATLRLYCGSLKHFVEADLDNPLQLLKSGCFNSNRGSMIYAFGFTEYPEGPDATQILQAYLSLRKYNVFLLDWEEEARAPNLLVEPIIYAAYAVPNAMKVGKKCGQALVKMSQKCLNLNTVHLIGHSLGAHLMGYCGQEAQRVSNKNVSRITGLDPAGPLYNGALSLDGLNSASAAFVDVLHTDPGYSGSDEKLGHVDVWFNCDKDVQPSCSNLTLLDRVSCDHHMAWIYFSDALLNPTSYAAVYDDSCAQWKARNDTGNTNIIYIGSNTDRRARGDFYISTNTQPPFGRGQNGLLPYN